jgi:glycosyltransferase involved in cell wall biosynthesis
MGPLVSVIVTTKNEEANISRCLDSVKLQDFPSDLIEIIVVDNNSSDRTKELALSYTQNVYSYGPERSAQRNYGIKQARGEFVLYLDADMSLSNGLISECVNLCSEKGLVALYIPERIIGKGYWTKIRDFERSFYNATVIDCVRFLKKDVFFDIGGFDEALTGPEDWDFDRRIRAKGLVGLTVSELFHNEKQVTVKSYVQKKIYYANSFEKYIAKWGKTDPQVRKQLGARYRYITVFLENGKWKKILRHPILTILMYAWRVYFGFTYLISAKGARSKDSVLVLTPFYRPNIGGVESYLNDLCEYLRLNNYPVTVITYQPLTTKVRAKFLENNGSLTIYRIPWLGRNLFHKLEPYPLLEFIYLTPGLLFFSIIYFFINCRRFKVIHTNGLVAGFIGKLLNEIFKKRLVMSTCAVYNFNPASYLAKIVRWIFMGSDRVLALGNTSKRELLDIGLRQEAIDVYNLWIDQLKYAPAQKDRVKGNLGFNNKFVVLFVGRFIEKKGVKVLLDVARQIDKQINFVFIGDNSPLAGLVRESSGKLKNVSIVEGIRGAELVPYYQMADLLVIPSLYDEAFGKVIIEALSCGTPVIGSNRGEIPSVINESVGKIVEPTVEGIKNAIEYFYSDRKALSMVTLNCRSYAEKYFSEKYNIEKIIRSYK